MRGVHRNTLLEHHVLEHLFFCKLLGRLHLLLNCPLLIALNLLQPKEILSFQFIQFTLNITNCILQPRFDNVF
eukprot:Gb_35085 [translate_table: standard]